MRALSRFALLLARNCIYAGLLSVSFNTLAATSIEAQDAVDEVFFEKEMEARLTRDIQAYLGHSRFIIGVDFKITGDSAPGGKDNVVVREVTTPLPGLPKTRETFVKELSAGELANLNENLQLDQQVGSRTGLIDNAAGNAFTGSGTAVYLVLDTTVSGVQENFIRDLIARKLGLDVVGGDGTQVVRADFSSGVPLQQQQIQPQQTEQSQPPPQQPFFQPFPAQPGAASAGGQTTAETPEELEARMADAIREAANQAAQVVSDAAAAKGGFLEQYGWLLFVVGLMFILLLVLIMFMATRRAPTYPQMMPPMPQPAPVPAGVGDATHDQGGRRSGAASPLAEVRREIATVGLAAPHIVRSEMDSLMAQNRIDLIAPTYRALGHNLFESLFGELPVDKQTAYNEYLAERDMSNTQVESQVKDLYTRLLRSANEDTDGSRAQAFRFLDKLHVSQIITLAKSEKTRVQALVISQLPSKKASEVLQSLEAKQRSEVLHELSQFESFPIETFRDVASGLARKVQSIPAVENITTDGISILINMLDNMSTIEENKILNDLENKNPDLFMRLKKQYFTYNDLARAPQKVMGEALLDIDKEAIAGALIGANEGITRRVLGSLPKRLADAVKSEMELLKGKISSEQIQADRKVILNVMRALVRDGKIDMEKL